MGPFSLMFMRVTHLPIAGIQARALGLREGFFGLANQSERNPPSRVELKPPIVITIALPLEKAYAHWTYIHTYIYIHCTHHAVWKYALSHRTISWPGNFSKMKGAFQMPMEKPAQNRKMEAR